MKAKYETQAPSVEEKITGRSLQFSNWLTDPTPEKTTLLLRMERYVRMVSHVKDLTGSWDDKILLTLMDIGKHIREAYENNKV